MVWLIALSLYLKLVLESPAFDSRNKYSFHIPFSPRNNVNDSPMCHLPKSCNVIN